MSFFQIGIKTFKNVNAPKLIQHLKSNCYVNKCCFIKIWFHDWPFGENWILCDQLAMVAALDINSIKK